MGTFLDEVPAPAANAPAQSAPSGSDGPRTFLDLGATVTRAASGDPAAARRLVPHVIDIIDRPRQAAQAAIAGDDWLRTLIHHAGPDQQDRNRAVVRQKIGMPGEAERAQAHGLRGGVDDFLTDTLTDPVTYASGGIAPLAKLLGRGVGAAGRAAARVMPKTAAELGEYRNAATDFVTYGGPAKRALGDDTFHGAVAADNRQAAREAEGARRLTARFDTTIAKLPDADRLAVYQVLNGERDTRGMPAHLVAAVAAAKKLRNDAGALWGDESARRKLAYGGGRLAQRDVAFRMNPPARSAATSPLDDARRELEGIAERKRNPGGRKLVGRVDRQYDIPETLRDFAAPADQGVLKAGNVRANYLPGPRSADAELVADNAPAREFNLLTPFAPNAEQREAFSVADHDLPALDEAFRGMLTQAARQGTAGRLRQEVGVRRGGNADPALVDLFARTTRPRGTARTTGQKFGDRFHQAVEIPKNTVTTIGLAHGLKNVPDLALRSEGPGAAAEALALGSRIAATKDPAKRYDLLRPGIEGGVISPSAVRENPIADTLARMPLIGPTIGKASQKANDLTWAIDDAAKQAVYRRKIARGMTPAQAAGETLREMVDYRHRSKATELLSNVAPFATFRSSIPAAIGSSTLRSPRRALALDRATSGLASSGKGDVPGPDGQTKKIAMTTPGSDVFELGDEPQRYARAMLADPLKALLSPVTLPSRRRDPNTGDEKYVDQQRYFTYGQPLGPHRDKKGKLKAGFLLQQLAGYAPLSLGADALNAAGAGEFPQEDLLSALLGGTLGAHVR